METKIMSEQLTITCPSCSMESTHIIPMPVGTIITEDASTKPPHGKLVAFRFPGVGTNKFSDRLLVVTWSRWLASDELGTIWWPIPEGMFEPPEDK